MTDAAAPDDRGMFDARYLAFLGTIPQIRPKLLRYCARMTGSVLDGEDVVQDALFDAYRKLDTFDDARPLGPWLFRIAHNRCIDLLRRRGVREEAEAEAAAPDAVAPVDPPGPALGRAVEHLVLGLPPMERACVLLKDVFDHSLEDIAPLVDSTVGGVKAALSRGRGKLAAGPTRMPPRKPRTPEKSSSCCASTSSASTRRTGTACGRSSPRTRGCGWPMPSRGRCPPRRTSAGGPPCGCRGGWPPARSTASPP